MSPEYLTTKELAELLRIKERKVYDLAASGDVPCSRAMGKLLFPRRAIDIWLSQNASGYSPEIRIARPDILLGSHDPLLDWALRESRSDIATIFDGSLDGLERFSRNEGIATGLHIFEASDGSWNVHHVAEKLAGTDVVLIEWAKRQRGLLLNPAIAEDIKTVADLKGRRVVPRQKAAGSQILLDILLNQSGLNEKDVQYISPSRTETDCALAVNAGKADAAFGLEAQAAQFGLTFRPVTEERFDLLIDRRCYFEPPIQTLLEFCRSPAFQEKTTGMLGYDVSGLGRIHFNG